MIVGALVALAAAGAGAMAVDRSRTVRLTYGTIVRMHPRQAHALVAGMFSPLAWVDVQGPGIICKGRRNRSSRMLIVSVDIIDRNDGTTEVRAWIHEPNGIGGTGFTVSNGALKAKEIANRLRRHPAFVDARVFRS